MQNTSLMQTILSSTDTDQSQSTGTSRKNYCLVYTSGIIRLEYGTNTMITSEAKKTTTKKIVKVNGTCATKKIISVTAMETTISKTWL